MEYIFTFLEGIASFISPCVLPMLPIYISYFMGKENKKTSKALVNASGFVLGFSIVFVLLSVFASKFGEFVSSNMKYIKIVFGSIIILLGFNYMEILKLKFFSRGNGIKIDTSCFNFVKSFLFGVIFSISFTPCIGTFLASALLLIAKEQNVLKGIILMVIYSMGLGIPFIVSVVLIEKLKELFQWVKEHFGVIKKISGLILILMGVYMMFF